MRCRPAGQSGGPEQDQAPPGELVEAVVTALDVAIPRIDAVRRACERLQGWLRVAPLPADLSPLQALLPLLQKRTDTELAPIQELLDFALSRAREPWPLLSGWLEARSAAVVQRALESCHKLLGTGALVVDSEKAAFIADSVERHAELLTDDRGLLCLEEILHLACRGDDASATGRDVLRRIYLEAQDAPLRRLAARLLDRGGEIAPADLARRLLGLQAFATLQGYLDYTRASHMDLLYLSPGPGCPVPAAAAIEACERKCGTHRLRQIVAELGWPAINLGLDVRPYTGLSLGDSVPLWVLAPEAALFEGIADLRRIGDQDLVIAHGGWPSVRREDPRRERQVAHFGSYNLIHAELLADILDVAPLSVRKAWDILARMDRLVQDFIVLFGIQAPECAILPQVYADLHDRVAAGLRACEENEPLPAEVTRLIQMFEDPSSLACVQTLHGLKRHLHQRGLKLGVRFARGDGEADRTVDILVLPDRGKPKSFRKIRYVDFASDRSTASRLRGVPFPVAMVAESFARQALYGHEHFPAVEIFCYGTEVHYYLAFMNHPAFLRIDFSPPLRGGMIDLRYYAVSQYELSGHPALALDNVRAFFRTLEFDILVDGVHLQARYDKEQAVTVADLCSKAEALFCLVPYLLDLEWILAGIELEASARRQIASGWAAALPNWGVLPVRSLLSSDGKHVRTPRRPGFAESGDACWQGATPYTDRLDTPQLRRLALQLAVRFGALGLAVEVPEGVAQGEPLGQLRLEKAYLKPLREAVRRGQVEYAAEGYRAAPETSFQSVHETRSFVRLLTGGDEPLLDAAAVASQLRPLERILKFATTGSVNGYEVQSAQLPLRGDILEVYVLRDRTGVIRLGICAGGEALWRRRRSETEAWEESRSCPAAELGLLLRQGNYVTTVEAQTVEQLRGDAAACRALFRTQAPPPWDETQTGTRTVQGMCASPGQTTGRAFLTTTGRPPSDCAGAVLVLPAVRPDHNSYIYHSAGVVSTGGGILSHAGLIATQFGKPALIISGRWPSDADHSPVLRYRSMHYEETKEEIDGFELAARRYRRTAEESLHDGDLVVLDATAGSLTILGQDPEALALYDLFVRLKDARRSLGTAAEPEDRLMLRGRVLQAEHEIDRALRRLEDPTLTKYAVRELLQGEHIATAASSGASRARFLAVLLAGPKVGALAADELRRLATQVASRSRREAEESCRRIPQADSYWHVISARLCAFKSHSLLAEIFTTLSACRLPCPPPQDDMPGEIDLRAARRLQLLHTNLTRTLACLPQESPRLRHVVRQVEQLGNILGRSREPAAGVASLLCARDEVTVRTCAKKQVLRASDGGLELHSLWGWKAAHLAEIERLAGPGRVPPWFAVSDRAFREVLGRPGRSGTLASGIEEVLADRKLQAEAQSLKIRELWEHADLPPALCASIRAAYAGLCEREGGFGEEGVPWADEFVAVRSSTQVEDAQTAARAGEFDTFLFVRGQEEVLSYLKRAWAGLWTERAIHNRRLYSTGTEDTGGGVIVQRMVQSRASGVLLTVNAAERRFDQMVINVGLGQGEGVVSGVVETDHVVVDRSSAGDSSPLRVHYVTGDKTQQVIFNQPAGFGTVRTQTLYHQRFRPALEYTELVLLVRIALNLEAAFGHPLDIEFALAKDRLWILQARPIPALLADVSETLQYHPLVPPSRDSQSRG